jgi:hypothetical protein
MEEDAYGIAVLIAEMRRWQISKTKVRGSKRVTIMFYFSEPVTTSQNNSQ